MGSADTTRDRATSELNSSALLVWQDEVRTFLQRTLEDIQRATTCTPSGYGTGETDSLRVSTRVTPSGTPCVVATSCEELDQMDVSRRRLENLKRRLAEQLRHKQSDTNGADRWPIEEGSP